jgi:formylglycine-generating enzyme required for sulfatase activity
MGKFPITQAQWQRVMGNNPAKNPGERHPVENIAWNDAQEFCKKLSQQTGRSYRLPSEAEWEYACRAGKTTPFSFGPTLNSELANYNASQVYRDEAPGKNRQHSSPVGRFPANAFGLYDMHGNVWEWCEDVWHKSYAGAPGDGSAWVSDADAPVRILRGGSWNSGPDNCRAAIRNTLNQQERFDIHGLRVVCSG